MSQTVLAKESAEYVEILSEVFADLVRKGTSVKENGEITQSLVQCLQYIYLHGPSPIRKIASGLAISIPAVSQLVERLVQKELVVREHCEQDRRLALVELTDAGKMIIEDNRETRLTWLRDILSKMPQDSRTALVNSIEEFIQVALETTHQVDEACAKCGIDHLAFCVLNKAYTAASGKPKENY